LLVKFARLNIPQRSYNLQQSIFMVTKTLAILLYRNKRKALITCFTYNIFQLSITKVSRKGQITLHEHVRKELGIKPGDILEEQVENGKIVLRLSEAPSVSLRGIGKRTKKRLRIENSTEYLNRLRRKDYEEL